MSSARSASRVHKDQDPREIRRPPSLPFNAPRHISWCADAIVPCCPQTDPQDQFGMSGAVTRNMDAPSVLRIGRRCAGVRGGSLRLGSAFAFGGTDDPFEVPQTVQRQGIVLGRRDVTLSVQPAIAGGSFVVG